MLLRRKRPAGYPAVPYIYRDESPIVTEEDSIMLRSRELLLRYYHDTAFDFTKVRVCYVNRGAPGDMTCIGGERIQALDPFYMEIESGDRPTPIPYHRIITIRYAGEITWEAGPRASQDEGRETPDRGG